ncbi:carboxymuconolactone decarboxylase family protein [Flavobacterium sp. MK4S-17]|uniref:carboxymuconolactone decarboxylase family protein n=1 Tax=Flavobacterium sp. MK4S-17 TaxID=2543737 RepID=UPI001359917C|nr:carboxymuconolactone decarboxylase family protein [Flavobacterium sp. MK4S-17]
MSKRIVIKDIDPNAYKAMAALEKYMAGSQLSYVAKGLIKIRASQINGCAYCIQIHTQDARKAGETEQRIYALSAWWESPLFSDEEKALLAVTDEITRITDKGLSDQTYAMVSKHFSESEIAAIIMQIVIINAWNRIAIATHLQHPIK